MNVNAFKQINQFAYSVMRQSNTRHLSWMKQFAGRLQSEIVTAMGASVPQLLSQAIAELAAATAHEDDCYLIITKSEFTPQIANLDNQRDNIWVGAKSMADAMSRIGNAEQKEYANQLLDLAKHYKVDISERYDDQTTKMDQFLQVVQTAEWAPRLQALGLTATIDEIATINQQMKQLIDRRNDELSTITPQAMVLARQASDEAYQLAAGVLNAFAIAQWNNGASPFDTVIAHINQDQDYYEKNVFAQAKGGTTSGQGAEGGSQSGQNNQTGNNTGNTGNNGQQTGDNTGNNGNDNPGGDTPGGDNGDGNGGDDINDGGLDD
jgi:hypothetical protein